MFVGIILLLYHSFQTCSLVFAVAFLYMIEQTLAVDGHNPAPSQILKVISSTTYQLVRCCPSTLSPHSYWVFHHKEAHLFGMVDQPWGFEATGRWKEWGAAGEFMNHVLPVVSWELHHFWVLWNSIKIASRWYEVATTRFCMYSLYDIPALKSNTDLENGRVEKEIQFGHCDVRVPS